MKKILVCGVALFGLAACGGGGESGAIAEIEEACKEAGEATDAQCNCMSEQLAKSDLSGEQLEVIAKMAKLDDQNPEAIQEAMGDLSMSEMMEFGEKMEAIGDACEDA